jgi:uncharacterized protein with HEPN domain
MRSDQERFLDIFEIDLDIVWSVLENDLKPLKGQIQAAMQNLSGS